MQRIGHSGEVSSAKLVLIGVSSAAFFSSTFVLNYSMSLGGGHWMWSAALRYLFMIPILTGWIAAREGLAGVSAALALFRSHVWFWLLSGTLGCGLFYAGICFAADHARGWVVASTWQLTVIASPLVLLLFGFHVPRRGFLFSAVIVAGIWLVNAHGLGAGITRQEIVLGVLPVLISAIAYPLGNQLLNAAKNGTMARIARIDSPLLQHPASAILLMTLGSMPFWLLLCVLVKPPAPGIGQVLSTLLVAVLSGVIATSIFFHARNLTGDPFRIAAVDASQAAEVVFALLGELLALRAPLPDRTSLLGLLLLTMGLVGYCLRSAPAKPAGAS